MKKKIACYILIAILLSLSWYHWDNGRGVRILKDRSFEIIDVKGGYLYSKRIVFRDKQNFYFYYKDSRRFYNRMDIKINYPYEFKSKKERYNAVKIGTEVLLYLWGDRYEEFTDRELKCVVKNIHSRLEEIGNYNIGTTIDLFVNISSGGLRIFVKDIYGGEFPFHNIESVSDISIEVREQLYVKKGLIKTTSTGYLGHSGQGKSLLPFKFVDCRNQVSDLSLPKTSN